MATLYDGIRYLSEVIEDRYPRALTDQFLPTILWEAYRADPAFHALPATRLCPLLLGAEADIPSDSRLATLAGSDALRFDHHRVMDFSGKYGGRDIEALAQGYMDALILFGVTAAAIIVMANSPGGSTPAAIAAKIRLWADHAPELEQASAGEFFDGIPATYWTPSQETTLAFIAQQRTWALSSFQDEDMMTGRFMDGIVSHAAGSQIEAERLEGIRIARDTLLAHLDFLVAGPVGWNR